MLWLFFLNQGAKRKLTFLDGTSLCEKVIDSNGIDSIRFALSEHPFPCKILTAHNFIEKIDDKTSKFTVAFQYLLKEGTPDEAVDQFKNQIQELGKSMVGMLKDKFDKEPEQDPSPIEGLGNVVSNIVKDIFGKRDEPTLEERLEAVEQAQEEAEQALEKAQRKCTCGAFNN